MSRDDSDLEITSDSILVLGAKLGLAVAGVALCPAAGVPFAAAIAGGIIGNSAWESLKGIPSRLLKRPLPLGQPNHDLNKALAAAIAKSCQDFQADFDESAAKAFRQYIGEPTTLLTFKAHQIEAFFGKLEKTPEGTLQIVADNTALKQFLEDPSGLDLLEITRGSFPENVPAELRTWIVGKLHHHIAARFWDEVKNTPAAWRAYAAEVFKEFRGRFDTIDEKQDETQRLLKELIAKQDAIVGIGYDPSLTEAENPPLSEIPPIPPEVLTAIDQRLESIEKELIALNAQLKTLLAVAERTETKIDALPDALEKLLEEKFADLTVEKRITAERVRAHLAEASQDALETEVAEAGTDTGLLDAARAAHAERLSRIDSLARQFAELEGTAEASEIFDELTRIVEEEGVEEALAYLGSQRPTILAEIAVETAAQEAARRKKLQPLLTGAQLSSANGKNDEAESLFRDVIKAAPSWTEARYQFCRFLTYTRGPRAQSHATLTDAKAIYEEAHRIAKQLVEDEPENEKFLRELSVSHNSLGDVAVAQGDLALAAGQYGAALVIAEKLAASDPGNAEWQRDLSVSHTNLGDVAVAQGDLALAAGQYGAALVIAEKLAASDPGNAGWQRDLSVSHEKLGDVAVEQGDLALADGQYRAGLVIAEKLAASDPGNAEWQRDLSVSHDRLGNVAAAQGDLALAAGQYGAALAIREKLVASDPGNAEWQRDLSISHNKLGDVAVAQGDLALAAGQYGAGLAIREKLAASDPGNAEWQRNLSVSHDRLGDVAVAQGDLTLAAGQYSAGLAIREKLTASDPGNAEWQRDLAVSHSKLAVLAEKQEDDAKAAKEWRASYEALNGLRKRGLHVSPDDLRFLQRLEVKLGIESPEE